MEKYIDFIDAGSSESGKTKLWHVVPKQGDGSPIGLIHWYGPWRKYCFSPHHDTIYEQVCLRDIADFCEQQTTTQKNGNSRFPISSRSL
jgi:hypothetical protein